MPDPDVRPGTSKDIVMREFVNDTIKIEMKNTQGHKKPGSKARLPPYQRKGYGHDVEPHRAHHDPEFLVILNPGMHNLQSSQGVLQHHTQCLVDPGPEKRPRGTSLQR